MERYLTVETVRKVLGTRQGWIQEKEIRVYKQDGFQAKENEKQNETGHKSLYSTIYQKAFL